MDSARRPRNQEDSNSRARRILGLHDVSAFMYQCEARGIVPVNTGRDGGYPEEQIEETEEHKIWRDGLGRTMKLTKGMATLPLPLDYPVRTMDDWLKIKPWYEFYVRKAWEIMNRESAK